METKNLCLFLESQWDPDELVAKLLAEPGLSIEADVLVIGDSHVLEMGRHQAGVKNGFQQVDPLGGDWVLENSESFAFHPTQTIASSDVKIAEATKSSGASVLSTLDIALDFAKGMGSLRQSSLLLSTSKQCTRLVWVMMIASSWLPG